MPAARAQVEVLNEVTAPFLKRFHALRSESGTVKVVQSSADGGGIWLR